MKQQNKHSLGIGQIRHSVFFLLGFIFFFCMAHLLDAAITPTGDVEPVETWGSSTTGYIGNTSDGNLLVDGGSVLQSNYGYLGYQSGVSGTVMITGAGSKWSNSYAIYVGNSGTGTLRIEAGGKVSDSIGYLGYNAGSSGTAIVTGTGSTWTNTASAKLYVGNSGTGTLRIEAGGKVSDVNGYLGYNAGSSGTAIVTGTGSTWTNSSDLYVGKGGVGTLTVADGGAVSAKTIYASLSNLLGDGTITAQGAVLDADLQFNAAHPKQASVSFGSGGTLTVTAGGGAIGVGYKGNGSLAIVEGVMVSSPDGYLGYNAGSSGTATVTGSGSTWYNSSATYVGNAGTGTLRIEAGGLVYNRVGYLGYNAGSSGTAMVTGTGSTWTNSSDLYVGKDGVGTLTVADGGAVSAKTIYASLSNLLGDGTITAQGAVLDADLQFNAAHPKQASVSFGSGGTLTVTASGGAIGVGYKGNGSLAIIEGVMVSSPDGYLGYNAGSSGMATVTSAGSKWNTTRLYIGNSGTGTLHIEMGGQVSDIFGYLGTNSSSSGTATVAGSGSNWSNTDSLYVGNSGTGNLRIEAGGQVSDSTGYLGNNSGVSGMATVTGSGSSWTNSSAIYVGNSGTGTLRIEAGGQVSNSKGYLGYDTGASGTAMVTGDGSKWINNSQLYIGNSGTGTLRIEAGGQVSNYYGYLGYGTNSLGTATVTGAGSKWTNSNYSGLYVGYYGTGTLRIEAGGQVSDSTGYLGYGADSSSTATVTGTGSTWTNNGSLYVGYSGTGTLTVADGGSVTAATLYASLSGLLGDGTITTQGAVLDANLRFDAFHPTQAIFSFGSRGTLTVTAGGGSLGAGYKGNGSLTISEGVVVTSSYGYLGYHVGSSGTATVTGSGSKWSNSDEFYIGNSGTGVLRIEAGGQVSDSTGYIGYNTGASGTAIVKGSGSTWINSNAILVGVYGTGELRVEAGGWVSDINGYIGSCYGSSSTAMVTGTGSTWSNSRELYVGLSGTGTLTVADGGVVTAGTLYASLSDLLGDGTITTQGAVLDADIRFDATHPSRATIFFGSGGTLAITAGGGALGAGFKENGSLTIAGGVTVTSSSGWLGYTSGSLGTATVTGSGSTWTNGSIDIGRSGTGTLRIEAGGRVSNSNGDIGYNSGSSGTAMVTGTGSKWTISSSLSIGNSGNGTLHIRDGGAVAARSVSISSSSLLSIDFGYGSNFSIGSSGTGTFTNGGVVRLLAGPQTAVGSQYSPIAAGTWSGSGSYQAVGGTWNATSHVFTVSQTLAGLSGTPVSIDLAQQQRVLVNDTVSGWTVGSSFLAKTGSGNSFNFTATTVAGADLSMLSGLLEPGQSVLSGWNLSATGSGYYASDPVYVSLGIPAILSHGNVQLWRFNSGSWSRFTADDLTANDGYASFTSIGLSNYAVSAALPVAAWKADANGLWQTGTNWTTEPNTPGGVNVAALLGSAISGPRTVTLGGAVTLGVLTFDSAQHYTLSGTDSLSMQVNPGFTAKIDVQNSDAQGHVIETPLTVSSLLEIAVAPSACLTLSGEVRNPAGQTITLSGGGTLVVSQGIVTTGTINVQAGTLDTPSLVADTLNIGSTAAAAVPEPSMVFLLLAAMAGIGGRLVLRRK